jgi:hypothetical protein
MAKETATAGWIAGGVTAPESKKISWAIKRGSLPANNVRAEGSHNPLPQFDLQLIIAHPHQSHFPRSTPWSFETGTMILPLTVIATSPRYA